ncbi:MAG: peptidoglycan-binding domain-containing protein, partial [Fibrobacterota bacterium]
MADFHDINSPGEYRAKTDEPQQTNQVATATDEEEPQQQKPAEPEICLLSATFEPDKVHGYSLNKGCRVTGTAEFLKDTSMTKVTLKLYAVYDGTEEDLQINQAKYGTANINKKDNTFTFPDVPLYNPTGYPDRDGFKTPVTYKAVISATRAKKPLECTLELPQESTPVPPLLQKDMYDDKATEKYPSKYQKGGKGYVEGTPIFDYQQVLEQLNYLPKGTANGVFGPKTDEATRAFQTDSTGKRRVKKSSGKLVEAEKITYTDVVDGIVGQKTRDELSVWQTNNYLRPLPNLYHGDFDKEAVQKGIKDNPRSNTSDPVQKSEEENGDDYHDVGTPVL